MRLINVMFRSGLTSDPFRENIERHGTEDTTATYKAIKKRTFTEIPRIDQYWTLLTNSASYEGTDWIAKTTIC